HQGIGKNGHSVESTLIVNDNGKIRDGRREPAKVDDHGTKWVAENVTEKMHRRDLARPEIDTGQHPSYFEPALPHLRLGFCKDVIDWGQLPLLLTCMDKHFQLPN